jgi:hypothetical protein
VFDWSVCGIAVGFGGNGGSSTAGVGAAATFASSVRPSDDTLTLVMDVGSASPLLDLRLVRNLVGESSFGFFASPGSSAVAPRLTPMLSFAVSTSAGALDRQLPVPFSHFFPRGVCEPDVFGVDAPFVDIDSAIELLADASGSISLPLGVLGALLSGGASGRGPSAGACEFGFDFLRGFMRARREREVGRRKGRYSVLRGACEQTCAVQTFRPEAGGLAIG